MPTEIELKYRLDEDAAQQLLTSGRIGPFRLGPFQVKKVIDTYYDTPDRRVQRAGLALRFRQQETKPSALQLKSLTRGQGAWHARQEQHIPTDQPTHPHAWPDTDPARWLKTLLHDQPLQPLFTIHQTRHEAPVLDDQGHPFALLSLDQVRWLAGPRQEEAWELEIELQKAEDAPKLQALQQALAQLPSLQPQVESKYERGLRLL